MNIVPTWPIAAGALVVGLLGGAGAMRAWDSGQIADLKMQAAQAKQRAAEDVSKQYQAAFSNMEAAALTIRDAAAAGQASVSALGVKLDAINRNLKNAKPPPLPVDCRPGAERVRNIAESAAAVDAAIARPVPGR